MDYLASVTDLKVFGCSIDFLQSATQTYLEDPIWDRLQQSMAYTVVFKDSSVTCYHRNNSKDGPDGLESVRGMSLTGRGGPERVRGDVKLRV